MEERLQKENKIEKILAAAIPVTFWTSGVIPFIAEATVNPNPYNLITSVGGTLIMGGLSYIMYIENL